jgi:hypothetical protein
MKEVNELTMVPKYIPRTHLERSLRREWQKWVYFGTLCRNHYESCSLILDSFRSIVLFGSTGAEQPSQIKPDYSQPPRRHIKNRAKKEQVWTEFRTSNEVVKEIKWNVGLTKWENGGIWWMCRVAPLVVILWIKSQTSMWVPVGGWIGAGALDKNCTAPYPSCIWTMACAVDRNSLRPRKWRGLN